MRNAGAFVREALQSVLSQADVDLEVVVIDDGSTDDSASIVRSLDDARVRLLPGPCRGISAALNTALAAARGEIITRCDADDRYPPGRLAWQARWLAERPEFAAVCGRFATVDDDGERITELECEGPSGNGAAEITSELLDGHTRTHLCTFAIRADALRLLGGFREYFVTAEDIDLQMRLAHVGRVWFEPRCWYEYRLHRASITHSQSSFRRRFFEELARNFSVQRLQGGQDDLERGQPPAIPDDLAEAPTHPSAQIQGMLLGQAWREHEAGDRWQAVRTGWRACWVRPANLAMWKSLVALTFKRTSPHA
jgi:glycosyltransferase involved in cell wall biosynthesis